MAAPITNAKMTSSTSLPNLEGQIRTQAERLLKDMDKACLSAYEDDSDLPFMVKILDASMPLLLNPPSNAAIR